MATPQAPLRSNQKMASSLNSKFNGTINVLLLPVEDEADLKFTANVTFLTGDTATPNVTFTPCSDTGMVKEFNDADDCVKWLNGAFYDIATLNIAIDDFTSINKKFVPPTDAQKFATAQKAKFTKLVAGIEDKLVVLNAKVQSEIALGWPTSQYPALVAVHQETLKQRDTVAAIKAFYVAEVARFNAIINPAPV